MSALDDAIAASMAHAAGSMSDPLTDSLFEQQACTTPAPLAEQPPVREGWENEPIEVRFPWWLVLATVGLSCLASAYLSTPQ